MAGEAHWPALGVNVSVTLPVMPTGLNILLATPGPDQVPLIPLWVVGSTTGGSVSQIEEGTPVITGTLPLLTKMLVLATAAHCPGLGVKVKVVLPLSPVGSNVFPKTPTPDQFPKTPP